MKPEEATATQCYLAGGLHMAVAMKLIDELKVLEIVPNRTADGFVVSLASGLKLAVKVEVLERPTT
jgi:hypothetical protein